MSDQLVKYLVFYKGKRVASILARSSFEAIDKFVSKESNKYYNRKQLYCKRLDK